MTRSEITALATAVLGGFLYGHGLFIGPSWPGYIGLTFVAMAYATMALTRQPVQAHKETTRMPHPALAYQPHKRYHVLEDNGYGFERPAWESDDLGNAYANAQHLLGPWTITDTQTGRVWFPDEMDLIP